METPQLTPDGAASVVSCISDDMNIPMQRSTSSSTSHTNLTDPADDDKDPDFPAVTFATNEDDLVSTASFEARDDRPFTGCMSVLVHDVTDGWYQLEHIAKSCSDIHSCKAPSFNMPSCNADAFNCGNGNKTQTATLWFGGSRISCTFPVCSYDTSYDVPSSRGGATSQANLMDMYEYDDDDKSSHSLRYSYEREPFGYRRNSSFGHHSGYRLGRSLSLARSGKGVSRIKTGIAQVGSLGKKVSKPSMKMIKILGRKDKALSDIEGETRDEAEDPSFVHAAATEVKESMNKAGSKTESKLEAEEEQNAILSSINHETAKVSNSTKLAADATVVTSHATNTVSNYMDQQKIMDEHTKALKSHTNAISQRLLAVEQKMSEANGVVPVSEMNEDRGSLQANNNDVLEGTEAIGAQDRHDSSILVRCTVIDEGSEEIEVVDDVIGESEKGVVAGDDDNSMCPSHSTGSSASSGSSSSIASYIRW